MENILTKEQQKEIAVNCLKTLGSYEPYTKAFKEKGIVTMYEGFGGYYLDPAYGSEEEELIAKIKEVEEEYGGTVYAVIHGVYEFGDCYTMLYISKYAEDAEYAVEKEDNAGYAFSYVWNKSCEDFSEFGTAMIKPALGGLIRVA